MSETITVTGNGATDLVVQQFFSNMLSGEPGGGGPWSRRHLFQNDDETVVNIERECGYPRVISKASYRDMYERNGVASRVVDVFPNECWSIPPRVYEKKDADTPTAFDIAWQKINDSIEPEDPDSECDVSLLHYLHRIDKVSGVGAYGLLLYGLDDGLDLIEPVEGIDDNGGYDPTNAYQLKYLRVFDETCIEIAKYETDTNSARYGRPYYYNIKMTDPKTMETGNWGAGADNTIQKIHWSRVQHVADNRVCSEIYGIPRMKRVWNYLVDLLKVGGGSAEMFWKGGFPGYAFETQPDALGNVNIDTKSLREELDKYWSGLQRYMALKGLTAKSLTPQVASPEYHIAGLLKFISIAIEVPMRVFIGSEEAKVSSTQDSLTWNKRLSNRQQKYITPKIIRPCINRLIKYGVLPRPEAFYIDWQDLNTVTDLDKSTIMLQETEALQAYVLGNVQNLVSPEDYFIYFMGKDPDTAKKLAAGAEAALAKLQNQMHPPVSSSTGLPAKAKQPKKTQTRAA